MDKEWFCTQIHNYEKSMYVVAYQILQNEEDVKDAIQEAILGAYCNLEQLRDGNSFKAWLMKMLINKCYDLLRKRKDEADITDYEDILTNSDENVNWTEKVALKDAVAELKEPYKTVVILYYYEGLSVKDISKIMDVKQTTIKKQMQRARQLLSKLL